MDSFEIKKRFGFHPATETTKPIHQAVRADFIELANGINALLPEGREKSLVMTHLQDAAMWAHAAIACNLAPQIDE